MEMLGMEMWRRVGRRDKKGAQQGKKMDCGEGDQPRDLEFTPLLHKRPSHLSTASSADEPTLSTSATLVIHFLKALSAPTPTLAPVPSRHLCTPRQNHGVVVSGPREDADLAGRHGPYSFALGPNPTVQRDWRLRALNGVCWGKRGGCGQGRGRVAFGSETPSHHEGGAGPGGSRLLTLIPAYGPNRVPCLPHLGPALGGASRTHSPHSGQPQ